MATAAEILAQIEIAKQEVEASRADSVAARKEHNDAIERQRLRRVLEALREARDDWRTIAESRRRAVRRVDADEVGPHLHSQIALSEDEDEEMPPPVVASGNTVHIGSESVTCSSAVVKGQYTWKIGGMSWLAETLTQTGDDHLVCQSYFHVGSHKFDFSYNPSGGDEGTLAIIHCSRLNVTFRYRIYIKRCGGDFVQWGQVGKVFHEFHDATARNYFGPDVPDDGGLAPQGIFGLRHDELLKSDWIEDDTLIVKFEIELRESRCPSYARPGVQVPPCTIGSDLSSLLDTGKKSDVTFLVEGEQIHAHSAILCARSEVFDRLLCGGMRESLTNQITIEDCDAASFKELLRFVYTDDFDRFESRIGAVGHGDKAENCRPNLQSLLAASHKYALIRLQLWCEQKLCSCLKVDEVCSILCHAHLYSAKQLIEACLCFIRQNYEAVAITQKFGDLARDWPEVMIKIHLFMGQVREDRAAPAVEAARKRKIDQV